MGRWQPDAQGRLRKAALELFNERGYDNTTVVEIAERAGLTKRTFFRYFRDKREVLFQGSEVLEQLFVETVRDAPAGVAPLDAVARALDAAAERYLTDRALSVTRQQVILATPELRERELIKLAALSSAVAQALRERGVEEPLASLTAETGIAVFRVAFERWVAPANDGRDGDAKSLQQLMRESLEALGSVVTTKTTKTTATATATAQA
jgi:AcrR family transcriptional regulator